MARTIQEITATIWTAWGMTPPLSNFSFRKQVANGIARAIWILESLFDVHTAETQRMIEATRFAYIPWLVSKIKSFQFGQELVQNEVFYDNTGLSEEDIAATMVVKQCAINELRRGLRIKVAGENVMGELEPLSFPQQEALHNFISKVRPFVPFKLTNQVADNLQLELEIHYDPLVLNQYGQRLDGTNDIVVEAAIKAYLKNLPFNGRIVIAKIIDALQVTEGVSIPHCVSATGQYAATSLLPFDVYYTPDAGYAVLATLNVTYIADENI